MSKFSNTGSSYGPISKFLHWVIAVLVILMLAGTYFISDIPDKNLRGMVFNIHKLTGLSILSLMIIRAIWALMNPKPKAMPGTKSWEVFAEYSVHFLFYLGLITMPILGWVASTAGGHPPRFGATALNLPLEKNEALSDLCFDLHNTLAIVLIVLISLHVLAALYHHFLRKDVILTRMWPH